MRFFTTEGPVNCVDHYCLPPLTRLDLDDVRGLLAQKKYFLLHAPRQTGKTTCLLALADLLNREGTYACVYANIETAQAARENIGLGIADVVWKVAIGIQQHLGDTGAQELAGRICATVPATSQLQLFLTTYCASLDKPLVLLLDEVDALVGDTLISVLRQLRAGYPTRPAHFPQSVVLCGVRDIQDYRIHASSEKAPITGGSAFNIKAESLRLGDFVRSEVDALLNEHTNETGQVFTPAARELIWELTQGQPWLVNALAYEVTWRNPAGRDRTQPVDAPQVQAAKEALVVRRVTHLDQLAHKLQEPRVRRVVEMAVERPAFALDVSWEDIRDAEDLGLVTRSGNRFVVANPMYRELYEAGTSTAYRELTIS